MSNLTEREIQLMAELKAAHIDIERLQNSNAMLRAELENYHIAHGVAKRIYSDPLLKSKTLKYEVDKEFARYMFNTGTTHQFNADGIHRSSRKIMENAIAVWEARQSETLENSKKGKIAVYTIIQM